MADQVIETSSDYIDHRDKQKFGDGTNYTEIESDGTIVYKGDATVWDDQQVEIGDIAGSGWFGSAFCDIVEYRSGMALELEDSTSSGYKFKFNTQITHRYKEGEDIELTKRHLQICIGPIEGVRLMGSNLRIMDDAFEYLLPTEAKKKKGNKIYSNGASGFVIAEEDATAVVEGNIIHNNSEAGIFCIR